MELTAPDQLWVADVTHIRLQQDFIYLAVVLDAFSRRVVGWAIDRSLRSPLAVDSLRKGLQSRKPMTGPVHTRIAGSKMHRTNTPNSCMRMARSAV